MPKAMKYKYIRTYIHTHIHTYIGRHGGGAQSNEMCGRGPGSAISVWREVTYVCVYMYVCMYVCMYVMYVCIHVM